jgi:cell division protein FtsQ
VSTFDQSSPRFFRPSDAARVRRNQRRIQLLRVGTVLRNTLFVLAIAGGAVWAYRQTQSDARFAVRRIEITGAVHTPRAALDAVTRRYVGLNLFKIDIARVQGDLRSLPWIQRIAIEKRVPDTLRIKVVERVPVALVIRGGALHYVDASGVLTGELSPTIGDSDLPVVSDADGAELTRAVAFLEQIRHGDSAIYSRIGEVRPIAPRGFAVFDRELGATVYANADDASSKWRDLYSIVQAEKLGHASIAYADLRFADRVVVKPIHPITTGVPAVQTSTSAALITN